MKRDELPKGSVMIPCPRCKGLRDYSHISKYVTDWWLLIPLIERELCQVCVYDDILAGFENGNIIVCTRKDVLGSETSVHQTRKQQGW